MTTHLFLVPTGSHTGLSSTALGLLRGLERLGIRVGLFKPISQKLRSDEKIDRTVYFARAVSGLDTPTPLDFKYARDKLTLGRQDELMEEIISRYQQASQGADVMITPGLVPDREDSDTVLLNQAVAHALGAEIILVSAPEGRSPQELDEWLALHSRRYTQLDDSGILGCVLNRVGEPAKTFEPPSPHRPQEAMAPPIPDYAHQCQLFAEGKIKLLGVIPWKASLIAPRALDIARYLDAKVASPGGLYRRRVMRVTICAHTLPNLLDAMRPGSLLVTPGDRVDVLVAASLAALSGVPLAGIMLTGGLVLPQSVMDYCRSALETGLPLLQTQADTYACALQLARMPTAVPTDDLERIEQVMESLAGHLDVEWIKSRLGTRRKLRLSPPAFRHFLSEKARQANKRIVLPEGEDPRTLQAAVACHERGLARCVLLGAPAEIRKLARSLELNWPDTLETVDPETVRERYVTPMVDLRRHKGLTPDMARAQLEDNVVLGTMMVALDEADGLVSGAVHTTANTVRPALQLIKTHENARVVSSVFFMCLPEQVLVYGDCAINPEPNAQELADIAIQSAESAEAFGVVPRVAMISYSTGESGTGEEVEKVREATRLARQRRPDLAIDGPLQYDAAADPQVAKSKAPESSVAGRATVFIFPDLNTGNTTYKAVQRSAHVISIGPVLQGLRKPVNDLSRGASIDDIIYTIAVTAIQAQQAQARKEQLRSEVDSQA